MKTPLRESEALVRTLPGHTDFVFGCAISLDGSIVASASADKTLKVWDASSGAVRATLMGHTDEVWACAISPDKSFLVSGGKDNTLRIWDVVSGEQWATLEGHADTVAACAIGPDGSFIVSASADKTLRIWDASSGAERATLEGHTDAVTACAISPDGSFIVSASCDKTVRIWDAVSGTHRATFVGHGDWVSACAVSPDGSFVVSAGYDKTLRVWDLAGETEVATLPFIGGVNCFAVHPCSPRAVCGDMSGALYLIDLVGIEFGPLIVTAVDQGRGASLRCPACRQKLDLEESWLGQPITCPTAGCGIPLRVNFFVAGPPPLAEAITTSPRGEEPLRSSMPATELEGEDAVFLRATPIARRRMDLLWLDPPRLAQLERPLAQHGVVTIVLGHSATEQREHEITQEDYQWAKRVESIVDSAHAAGQRAEYRQAIRDYQEALRMAPGCDLFLMSIGVCYAQLGDPAKGLQYLERAAEISPGSDRICDNLDAVRDMA